VLLKASMSVVNSMLEINMFLFLHLMSAVLWHYPNCLAFDTMVWLLQWHQPMVLCLTTQLLQSMLWLLLLVCMRCYYMASPRPPPHKLLLLLWERIIAIYGFHFLKAQEDLHRNDVQTTNVENSRWRSCTCNSRQRSCTWNVNWPLMF
jgi:hypothetical protein